MTEDNRPCILLVDDDERNLHSTKRVLEDLDVCIQTENSGEKALRAIVNREFFLILMDVQMPGMDGFETVSLIRGNDNYKDIPIIFMTAINKDDKYVENGYEEGAVDYLFKPINSNILKSKIKVFLDLYVTKKC